MRQTENAGKVEYCNKIRTKITDTNIYKESKFLCHENIIFLESNTHWILNQSDVIVLVMVVTRNPSGLFKKTYQIVDESSCRVRYNLAQWGRLSSIAMFEASGVMTQHYGAGSPKYWYSWEDVQSTDGNNRYMSVMQASPQADGHVCNIKIKWIGSATRHIWLNTSPIFNQNTFNLVSCSNARLNHEHTWPRNSWGRR